MGCVANVDLRRRRRSVPAEAGRCAVRADVRDQGRRLALTATAVLERGLVPAALDEQVAHRDRAEETLFVAVPVRPATTQAQERVAHQRGRLEVCPGASLARRASATRRSAP